MGSFSSGPGRFAILAVIHENPGLSQSQLDIATGRDKSTLALAVADLEKRGLVGRARSAQDGRIYRLSLTALGKKHLFSLAAHAKAHDERLDEIVGPFHKPLLLHLLEQIVTELEQDLNQKHAKPTRAQGKHRAA